MVNNIVHSSKPAGRVHQNTNSRYWNHQQTWRILTNYIPFSNEIENSWHDVGIQIEIEYKYIYERVYKLDTS